MDEDDSMEIDDTVQNAEIIVNQPIEIQNVIGNAEEFTGIAEVLDNSSKTVANNDISNKNKQLEAVVIVDDDDEPTPSKKLEKSKTQIEVAEIIDLVPKSVNSKCINYSCKSGKDLMIAPGMCLSYYRVKCTGKTNKEVCKECYNIAIVEYDLLASELKKGNLLFNVNVPLRNDMVEIEDSDEELDDEKTQPIFIDEKNFEFIQNNIEQVMVETLKQINFPKHIEDELNFLKTKNNRITESLNEFELEIKETRTALDNIQINLYNEFRPEIVESNNITIVHDQSVSNALLVRIEDPKSTAIQRKSPRNIPKPISYSELDDSNNSSNSPQIIKETIMEPPPPKDLPAVGLLIKQPAKLGDLYYIVRESLNGSWIRARLVNIFPIGTLINGQVIQQAHYKMIELKKQKDRVVDGKCVAYMNPSLVRLEMGTRVIAVFKDSGDGDDGEAKTTTKSRYDLFYPGVVGEPAVGYNKYRYLIFFDIGYSQYVSYNKVHVVLESSKDVWEDTHVNSQPFIKKYMESKDRPMVKLAKGQTVKIEYNGKWLLCTVKNVDCSLVQVHFNTLNRTEWIYRGSARLSPMYKEELAATNRQTGVRNSRKLGPDESATIVQYTRTNDFGEKLTLETPQLSSSSLSSASTIISTSTTSTTSSVRAVARKSTTRLQNILNNANGVPFLPPQISNQQQSHVVTPGPTTKIMYFTPRDQLITQRLYHNHICSNICKDYIRTSFNKLRGHNPLSKPLLCGWARLTIKIRSRKDIIYKAPCGRMLRNIAEVHQYLRLTNSEMTVDLFDFNQTIRCLAEFNVECTPDPKDLSKGLEQVPIPVINGINNEKLDFCNYSITRVPMEGVPLNTDPEFLCGCDCDDDCIDKTKCACWKLTLEGAKFMGKNVDPNSIGYIYRRLPESVGTGIYECNSRCKCSKVTCLNRVVQHPMSLKLQVFRTYNRGWGIRAVNDVPQGSFICIYAGTIHTEQMANEDGIAFGDEYFAELDYIEICEQYKQDYESEVIEPEDQRSSEVSSPEMEEDEIDEANRGSVFSKKRYNDDNDFVPSVNPFTDNSDGGIRERLRRRNANEEDSKSSDGVVKIKKDPGAAESTTAATAVNNSCVVVVDTVTISDDEDDPKEVLSFNPKAELDKGPAYTSVRTLFGKDEAVYVMDAKNAGNIGRFLNHSCSPNVFVQNVFVDTHDVRFPCVAFFSSQFIRAGTELTWNYNYDIGSVPGKIMYCHCASLECKGRLL